MALSHNSPSTRQEVGRCTFDSFAAFSPPRAAGEKREANARGKVSGRGQTRAATHVAGKQFRGGVQGDRGGPFALPFNPPEPALVEEVERYLETRGKYAYSRGKSDRAMTPERNRSLFPPASTLSPRRAPSSALHLHRESSHPNFLYVSRSDGRKRRRSS